MNQEHRRRSDAKESGIVQRVRKSVRALPFNQPHVLLACSGGKDSVALAHILAELNRLELITLDIAHVHHGQHDQADTAAEAVQSIGEALEISVVVKKLETDAIDSHVGVGVEEALRRERYLALALMAKNVKADCIAIAHHQGDQAETILLHLLRGSGLDGLVGMREWEVRQIPWWKSDVSPHEVGIWRPLLHESQQKVATLAGGSGLPIVEDPTNVDTSFRRNAIRHDLMPIIEQIAPGASAAIARTSDLLVEDANYLNQLTAEHGANIRSGDDLRRDLLVELPDSVQRRVIRAWILNRHPDLELSYERVSSVMQLVHRNRGCARVELGNHVDVELHDGMIILVSWQNRDD